MSEMIKRHPVFLSFLMMVAIATALLWTATSVFNAPAALADAPPAPSVKDILYRSGLDPVSLCALGLDADETNAVVLSCGAKADVIDGQLAIKDEALATARSEFITLRRKAQSGTADAGDLDRLETAAAEAAQFQADIDGLIASVVGMSELILSDTEETTLEALCENCSSPLPTEFRATTRADEEYAALRDALSQKAFAAAQSETLDQTMQTLLTSERAGSAVSLATTSLANDLATVTTAWETACATYE